MPTAPTAASLSSPSPVLTRSSRLQQLPVYVFNWLDELKAAAQAAALASNRPMIDLGMGNPDNPTPSLIVDAIAEAVRKPENHRYPTFNGKQAYREAIVRWMARRYGVTLDPNTQAMALIGSKEGLAHLSLAYADTDHYSIVFSPYYPVHSRATWLAGGQVYHLAMTPENQYMPDPEAIPPEILANARLLFINYPNNPTAATATTDYLAKLVAFCRAHNIVLVSDLAYGEIAYDGYKPPSVLSIPGAIDVCIEFHSFSKTFNMAGWRIGFAVGNADIIKSLFHLKTNMDYGLCGAIQDGAVVALDNAESLVAPIVATYQARRDAVMDGFARLGWPIAEKPKSTMYCWMPIPPGFRYDGCPEKTGSKAWTQYVLDTTGVVVTPGVAFGDAGDAAFRVSLVSPLETLQEALARFEAAGLRYDSFSETVTA